MGADEGGRGGLSIKGVWDTDERGGLLNLFCDSVNTGDIRFLYYYLLHDYYYTRYCHCVGFAVLERRVLARTTHLGPRDLSTLLVGSSIARRLP
jgi:hypothetical protein